MPLLSACAILLAMTLSLPSGAPNAKAATTYQQLTFLPVNVSIKAEVAATERVREKGLMFRKSLDKNSGMIFYFDQTGYHAFYMYNTRIPLTVIFLNESLRIVDIQEMTPCLEQNPYACPTYTPHAPCKYAIEVNQEFVREHGIKKGGLVRIQK